MLKCLVTKLKQVTANARRRRWNHVLCAACFMALVWAGCGPAEPELVPCHLRKYLQFAEHYTIPEKQMNETELKKLILQVEGLNTRADVMHWDTYWPVNSKTTIIVIRVHKDVERLQHLVISLGRVRHIHEVLLIFSHSYFDDEINVLVKSIDFCKVMQFFYPFSLQLNPDKFPGVDPNDCNVTHPPHGARAPAAAPIGPDCFERDARRTQQKQHWWWTANYVFELEWSSDKQTVIFLEETNYVFPDLLHMLHYTQRVRPYFPTVEVLSFGRPPARDLEYDLLTIDRWTPPYDKGLAFNKITWRKILERSSFYCFYDDCSWSYSLMPVFGNFSGGFVEMAACSAPRVVSTGVFRSGMEAAHWARRAEGRAGLFPERVRAVLTVCARGRVRRLWRAPARGNGGWGDLRDQVLCLDPLMTTPTELTTETTSPKRLEVKNVSYNMA